MITKLEQAARQVIDAWNYGSPFEKYLVALDEALAEQPEQEPVIDLSKVRHEDKCRFWDDERFCDCGADSYALLKWYRKDAAPVQQAEQEPLQILPGGGAFPFVVVGEFVGELEQAQPKEFAPGNGKLYNLGYDAGYKAALAEQNTDHPCGYLYDFYSDEGLVENQFAFNVDNVVADIERNIRPLYAAPVRTKDLTDDEMLKLCGLARALPLVKERFLKRSRLVIAADREKNNANNNT